jgi:hypothetical protein
MCQFTRNEIPGGVAGLPGHEVDDSDIVLPGLPESVTAWQRCWRDGIAPQLSMAGLHGLKRALESNDPRLLQSATTSPPPLQCVMEWPVEGCCALCFGLLDGQEPGSLTVAQLEEKFAAACWNADVALGEPAACRYLLNYIDETPREQMIAELLREVERELAQRQSGATEGRAKP